MRKLLLAVIAFACACNAAAAQRIVALGGDVTEFIHALQAEELLAGVDATSLYPPQARELPNVGYVRQLNAEGILALRPDLVIGNADAGPPQTLEQLRAAGVRVELLTGERSPQAVLDKLTRIATLLHRRSEGEALSKVITADFAKLAQDVSDVERRARVLFMLSPGPGSPMIAGRNTAAHAVIELAGGENVAAGFDGYKPVSAESLAALAPEIILVMEERVAEFGMDAVRQAPGVALTPAGRNARYVAVSANALLGFGPRTAKAARELFHELHGR